MSRIFKQKINWFVDINTSPDNLQVIKITCGGDNLQRRTLPFWACFKYWKAGRVKVRFSPASTLPIDPTGLSYEAGEQTVDPRDQFNPGLVRITNGEDIAVLGDSVLEGRTADVLFNTMMMDRRWFKFPMQSGFSRSAVPLFWGIGQKHQDAFPGSVHNVSRLAVSPGGAMYEDTNEFLSNGVKSYADSSNDNKFANFNMKAESSDMGIFQTGQKIRMGWMPTSADLHDEYNFQSAVGANATGKLADCIETELISVILPKAHKTRYYFRVYVSEEILFKDPVALNVTPYFDEFTPQGMYPVPLDHFVSATVNPVPRPDITVAPYGEGVRIGNNGGGHQ